MKKDKYTLIVIVVLIIVMFTVFYIKSCNNSYNKGMIIASPTLLTSENFNNISEQTLVIEENNVKIETVDYTLMTRSQIEQRISSLLELIKATEKWSELTEINRQAVNELNNAKIHLQEDNYLYPYSEEDFLLLSYMVYVEAGASTITDEEQCLVASVILNRRNRNGINRTLKNPTIKDIINETGQYAICRYSKKLGKNTFYIDTNSVDLSIVSDRCKENTRKVLEGEFSCPENVVFQALFIQGDIYKTFYHASPFNNTTYFCYGR